MQVTDTRLNVVLDLLSQGKTLHGACATLAMSPSTFYKHLYANPDLRRAYADAIARSVEFRFGG